MNHCFSSNMAFQSKIDYDFLISRNPNPKPVRYNERHGLFYCFLLRKNLDSNKVEPYGLIKFNDGEVSEILHKKFKFITT